MCMIHYKFVLFVQVMSWENVGKRRRFCLFCQGWNVTILRGTAWNPEQLTRFRSKI